MAVAVSYLGSHGVNIDGPIHTFTGISVGTPSADRYVVLLAASQDIVGNIISVKVNGVDATINAAFGPSSLPGAAATIHLPSGTTADVEVTFDGNFNKCLLHVYALTGCKESPVVASSLIYGTDTYRFPVSANGALIYAAWASAAAGNYAFTNITKDGQLDYGSMALACGSYTAVSDIVLYPRCTNDTNAQTRAVVLVFTESTATNTTGIDGDYSWHKFEESASLTISEDTHVEMLLVGGGGAAGDNFSNSTSTGSGGGGGGGVRLCSTVLSPGTYPVVVGGGGAVALSSQGGNGGDSSFAGHIAYGGGGGGQRVASDGLAGSSGGGAGYQGVGGRPLREQRSSQQGQVGGNGNFGGGGGGGAGAVGSGGGTNNGGAGGDGLEFAFDGVPTYYAGGGGGGTRNTVFYRTPGGLGGGGEGGDKSDGNGTPGVDGLGGGGGGMSRITTTTNFGRWGGDGVVFIRYLTSPPNIEGGTEIDLGGGVKVRKFTPKDGGLIIRSGSIDVEYLLVAGGGGPGRCNSNGAGGGGAGGLLTNYGGTKITLTAGIHPVAIGEGGLSEHLLPAQENGYDSEFNGLTAIGGGYGASTTGLEIAASGGSGGGANFNNGAIGGAGTAGQGYAGGSRIDGTGGSGGGGAGGVGESSEGAAPSLARGGPGVTLDIDGTSRTYAEGGDGRDEGDSLLLYSAPGLPPQFEDGTGSGCHGWRQGVAVESSGTDRRGADGTLVIRYLEGSPPTPTGASSGSRMLIGCSY
jgi:hypothetical protein